MESAVKKSGSTHTPRHLALVAVHGDGVRGEAKKRHSGESSRGQDRTGHQTIFPPHQDSVATGMIHTRTHTDHTSLHKLPNLVQPPPSELSL